MPIKCAPGPQTRAPISAAPAQPAAQPHAHPHSQQPLRAIPQHREHQHQPLPNHPQQQLPHIRRRRASGPGGRAGSPKSRVNTAASAAGVIRTARLPAAPSPSSLSSIIAGVGGTALLASAALHFGPQHPEVVISSVSAVGAPLQEFGPADVASHAFGPTRPMWALLLQSQHSTAASSSATAAAAGHLPFFSSGSSDAHEAVASMVLGARGAAEGVAAAACGAVDSTVDGYNHWLEMSPLTCKVVTGNFFTVAGDMLAQLGLGGVGGHAGCDEAQRQQLQAGGRRRQVDWMRTGRLCLETSVFGTPAAHYWFNLLDSSIMPDNPHCTAAVMTKMLADQILFAPLGLVIFFAIIKCLEGRPRDIPQTLQKSYVPTLLGGYVLWPLAGILNFALLPNEYRLLFNNCVNIIWTCFISIMSSGGGEKAEAQPATATIAEPFAEAAATAPSTPAPAPAPALQPTAATADIAAPAPSSHAPCVSASCIATDLAKAAVAAAAISAAAGDRPAFGCVAGIAIAVLGTALEATTHGLKPSPGPVTVTLEDTEHGQATVGRVVALEMA